MEGVIIPMVENYISTRGSVMETPLSLTCTAGILIPTGMASPTTAVFLMAERNIIIGKIQDTNSILFDHIIVDPMVERNIIIGKIQDTDSIPFDHITVDPTRIRIEIDLDNNRISFGARNRSR